jgi:hypothetical protein
MSSISATLLYEDQMGPNRQYGLHVFVMACVFDLVNGLRYRIEHRVDSRPLKGNGNLLKSTRTESSKIAADGRALFSIFDNDRVRDLLQLPSTASDSQVRQAILAGCAAQPAPSIFLLRENTESVLAAALRCDSSLDATLFDLAIGKSLAERDVAFKRLATRATRETRDCILSAVPSVNELVQALAGRLQADLCD